MNQQSQPGNYTAFHLVTMFWQESVMTIHIQYGAFTEETDIRGNLATDYTADRGTRFKRHVFEDRNYKRNRKKGLPTATNTQTDE